MLLRQLVPILLAVSCASAGTLRVSVKDPSKAAVPEASVRIGTEAGIDAGTKATGADGTATFPDLPAGKYSITVNHDGFAAAQKSVELPEQGESSIEIDLVIAAQETTVEVESHSSVANADPNYKKLRNAGIDESYLVENIVLKRDVGTLTLKSGAISFAAPVLGRVAIAVFSGEGSFQLAPAMRLEALHLAKVTGEPGFSDSFESAVFLFADDTYKELKQSLKTKADGGKNAVVLESFRHHVRHHDESPGSFTEYLLQGDSVRNLDADLLAELYNPKYAGSFTAYMHARKHPDLRFIVDQLGALPEILSPEEVALVSIEPNGEQDGVLYLTHYAREWENKTASSDEDKRTFTPLHYKIETVIGKNAHLASVATVTIQALRDGDRIVPFSLLPNLRVSRVSLGGKDVPYMQESRKQDAGYSVVLPDPTTPGQKFDLQIEYAGDKVVHDEGGGNFSVGARESWYPSLNVFKDRPTYDLTFKVPRRYTLVSIGKLVSKEREDDFSVTHWTTLPMAVAGFNYGDFKEKEITDQDSKYDIEAYATSELPDYLRRFSDIANMTPSRMANNAIVDAENSIRCFKYWFGDIPYGRIAITQQPQFNFGQSWPTLVYLPVTAFLDETQRYMMMGSHVFQFNNFIDEVTAHEVSHQWWGHLVGWSSYHDQWLSEGFAFFSAGLFLQATEKTPEKYLAYWKRARTQILDKNNFGNAPNDAGPVWMGIRLDTFKTPGAYNWLIYRKGGYALHMLRYLMQDPKTGDDDFIAMMHDFTAKFANKNASTEDFRAVVNQHMKPQMDLGGNNNINWFFSQYVYGSEVGSYHLNYKLNPEPDGKVLFTGTVTQSGVGGQFRMRVPIYLDFGQGPPVKLADVAVAGNGTSSELKIRLPKRPKKVLLNYNYDVLAQDTSVSEM